MANRVEPMNNTGVRTIIADKNPAKRSYFYLTFKDVLNILIATSVPIAIGIYTAVTTGQQIKAAQLAADKQQLIADESRQQHLYNSFIDDIYELHKDGELNDTLSPWAFANARYRSIHRQLDMLRKAHVLQFLKEKELIGRDQCPTGCEKKQLPDIIRLGELNFNGLQLVSETGKLNRLNFKCVTLDRVSLVGAMITNVDMSGAVFEESNLSGAKFTGSSLKCAEFIGGQLDGTDFGDSKMENATFVNVDLSTAKFTTQQLQQWTFVNTTLPNGTIATTSDTGQVGKYSEIFLLGSL